MVTARGLGRRFGDLAALEAVDLDIQSGDFVAIVGPSGCGKSTLLRLVAGLAQPSSGQLVVASAEDDADPPRPPAYVFQDPTLLPWRRVESNVALPLELRRRPRAEISRDVSRVLEMVGLDSYAHLFPRQLSGGMRMRASIARALVTSPRLLLMDEPFAALDEMSRQRLNEELLTLWQRQRWTCMFVTHSVREAVFLSRRVVVLTPRPGTVAAEVDIPFDYPRQADLHVTADFAHLVRQIHGHLRQCP